MAMVADVGESSAAEQGAADAATSPSAAAIDPTTLAQAVAYALASQQRARRSPLLISLAAALIAGLLGMAAAGYVALRADMSALHQQNLELHQAIVDLETRLRADMTGSETQLRSEMADMESRLRAEIADFRAEFSEFRAETNATLLEHTAQLARLETALGLRPS